VDSAGFGRIRSKGDKALFGGHDTEDMKNRLGIGKGRPLADFLPTLTITAKNLAAEMTNHNVESKDLYGEYNVASEHVQNNQSVRSMLLQRGIEPENLPPSEDIKIIVGTNQYTKKSADGQNDHQHESTARNLSEQYRVSPKTIMRDAKVAEAIDAIGEKSPEAKRKILSGEAIINKKYLETLASKSNEEISELAAMIEDGTYEKIKPEAQAGMKEVDAEFIKIAESFYSGLRKITKNSTNTEIKTVLRAHIDKLEELYRQM